MKFLVVSDIHGSADYTKKALEAYALHKPDQILLLGDILYHGPRNPLPQGYNPQEVVALLNPLADKIIAVRGNCDAEVDQMLLNFDILRDCAIRRRTASPAISICSAIFIFLSSGRKTESRYSIPAQSRCQKKIHPTPMHCWMNTGLQS